jgi:TP901 family phage tail tape measure protein
LARKIQVEIIGDARSYARALDKAAGSTGSFAGKVSSAGKTAAAGFLAIGAAAVTAGGFAVKSAIDFESSFAGVRKTVDATGPELDRLAKGFLDLSKRIPVNVNALNEIGEAAGQLGVQKKSILKFTEVIAKLGVSSNLAGEEGAAMLARFANITRMPQRDFDRLGATIVALGNAGASTEKEIAEMGLRLAGAGAQVGMTQAQILGLANALSSVGIEAEAGGSALSTAMISIDKAVMGGGKKLEEFARVAGMSGQEFAAAWRKDPSAALVSFIEGLARVKKDGGNVFTTLDKLGLGGLRVRDALLRASGAGDLLRKSLALGTKAWKENLALNKEAEQRFQTTAMQLQLLKNNVTAYAIVWGAKLLPAINSAILEVGEFVRKFGEADGIKAKFNVVLEGVEGIARDIAAKVSDAFAKVDWSAAGQVIMDGLKSALAVASGLAEAFGNMAARVDWTRVGKAVGPGLATAMVVAFTTLLDPGFWASNWELALTVAAVVFRVKIIEFAGRLATAAGRALRGMAVTAMREMGEGFASAFPAITSAVGRIVPAILGRLRDLPGQVATLFRFAARSIGQLVGDWVRIAGTGAARLPGAVLRALERLAPNVGIAFQMAVAKVREFIGAAYLAAFSVGKAIAHGIARGIYEKGASAVKAAIDWLSAQIPGWARKILGIESPSKVMAAQVGKPIADGIAVGFISGMGKVTQAMSVELRKLTATLAGISDRRAAEDRARAVSEAASALAEARKKGQGVADAERALARAREDIMVAASEKTIARETALLEKRRAMIQRQLDKIQATVERARDKAAVVFDKMAGKIRQAFDAETGAFVSPAGQALAAINDRRAQEDLARAVEDARERLAEAMRGDDPKGVIDAQRALARAEEDVQAESLRKQDDAAQRAWQNMRASMGESLDGLLALTRDKLTINGVATWGAGMQHILGVLEKYGIDFKTAGELLGDAFVNGLQAAISGTARAAEKVSASVSINARAAQTARKFGLTELASGGVVTGPTLALIGEAGPEAVIPLSRASGGGSARGGDVHVHVAGSVITEGQLVETVRRELIRQGRRTPGVLGGLG